MSNGRQKGRSVDDRGRDGGAGGSVREGSWATSGKAIEVAAEEAALKLERERSSAATQEAIDVLRAAAKWLRAFEEGIGGS